MVDDDDAVRVFVTELIKISTNFSVAAHGSAEEFLRVCPPDLPGCVIADMQMPGISGLDLHRRLQRSGLQFPVVIMTGYADVPMAIEAFDAGIFGLLEKPCAPHELLERTAKAVAWSQGQQQRQEQRRLVQQQLDRLTPRERQVLERLVAGQTLKQVAKELEVSHQAIARHRMRILEKMRVESEIDLVRLMIVNGLR